MIKSLKRIFVGMTLLTVVAGPLAGGAGASAAVSKPSASVQQLVDIGFIKGDGNGASAGYWAKSATKAQAAAIFLRLTGLEKEALAYSGDASYEDADKAGKKLAPAINYLRAHPHLGWLASDGRFEPQRPIDAAEYASVLLKALGYEAGVDYAAQDVQSYASAKGLTALGKKGALNNATLAEAAAQAMKAPLKSGSGTLGQSWNAQTNGFKADTLIQTQYGALQGGLNEEAGSLHWLGVPYAKAPVGDLRWKSPEAPANWEGVKQATEYAPGCLQLSGGKAAGSEDCLNLNIWRPADNGSKLPVLVFVHGGGNMTGSSKEFPGDVLAANTNSVIISIEYRLGAMGFLHHPALLTGDKIQDSGNFGLLDILQSLKWVKENIAAFGGDASNVTLSGQSAGGRDVMAALISPLGKGLFERAYVLSGGMTTASTAEGDAKSAGALVKIAIADGHGKDEAAAKAWLSGQTSEQLAAYMRSIPADKLVAEFGSTAIRMAPFPHLFRDGTVIPANGFEAIAAGSYTKVPMILGSTATEFSAFAFGDPAFSPSINDGSLLKDEKKAAQYAAAVKYGSELYGGFNVERAAEQLAKVSGQPPVYAYRFAWGEKDGVISADLKKLLGATHGSDMAFVTGQNVGIAAYFPQGYFSEQNAPGRSELVSAIHEYVQNFLYTGNPGSVNDVAWTPWQAEADADRILRLDATNEHADIAMSSEYWKKEDVLARMERELAGDPDTLALLKENVLAGRFFW